MGLDLIPKRCGCTKHPHDENHPDKGTTHKPDESCPFEQYLFPKGMLGTCCSLRGKVAARELAALGESKVSERMFEDMSAEEAIEFADELRAAADRREESALNNKKPSGAGWNGVWNEKAERWDWQDYSTFEQALDSIREAAAWYEKVGSLGYGVWAWY
jgi:hypothetical protein